MVDFSKEIYGFIPRDVPVVIPGNSPAGIAEKILKEFQEKHPGV